VRVGGALLAACATAVLAGSTAAAAPLAPALTVGVVASDRTERAYPGTLARAQVVAAEVAALGATPVPLSDDALARPGAAGVRVLVLPRVACLSPRERIALRRWVSRGGGLVGLGLMGRDDAHCRPVSGQGVGRNYRGRSRYSGPTEWAELSPALNARFLGDVRQPEATLAAPGRSPVLAAATALGTGPIAFRLSSPSDLWTEIAVPLRGARPLLRYTSRPRSRHPALRRDSVVAWSTPRARGRVVYVGLDLAALWLSDGAPQRPRDAAVNVAAARALLLGALAWTGAA
jgi:hypothetical protein